MIRYVVLLLACQTGPDVTPEFDPEIGPGLDLAMTQGLTEADHTEVAPGVFMNTDVFERGDFHYEPVSDEMAAALSEEDRNALAGPSGGGDSCYEFDSEAYSDTTQYASIFNGDPIWSAYATAYSYSSGGPLGGTDTNILYTSVATYAPQSIDYVYPYAYIYSGEYYVGYINDYVTSGQTASISGSWTSPCVTGEMELTVYTYHTAYDYPVVPGNLTTRKLLSVGNTLTASVTCCP